MMRLAAFLIPHSSPIVPRMLISRRHHMSNIPPERGFTFSRLPVCSCTALGSMLAMIEIFFSAVDLAEHATPPWQIVFDM